MGAPANTSQDVKGSPLLWLCYSGTPSADAARVSGAAAAMITDIPVSSIVASPYQPRLVFDGSKLVALAESIKEMGLFKPILVRPTESGFELVGGERRWRAVMSLGWATIPAIVAEMPDAHAILLAVGDNTGEPLTDYENALGYARILQSGEERSQAAIASKLGINKSTVSRCLQLIELPEGIQAVLRERPDLITSNYAKQFVDYAAQNPHMVERVVRSSMKAKGLGQSAALKLIGQKLSACTQVIPLATRKTLKGLGNMQVKGRRLEFSCDAGVDPSLLMEQFEAFLSNVDPSTLRIKPGTEP